MKRLIMVGLTLLVSAGTSFAGETAAQTNPALFYWQAMTLLPQVDASEYSRAADYYDRAVGANNTPLDESSDKLLASLDNTFRLVHKGFESKVECDWGIDMSDGPYTCLPHLAKAKWISQLGVNVRGRYFLQKGQSDAAVAETLATLKLGRDTARDGTLLSVLVQGAIENICLKFIADHFAQFDDASLQRLADGIQSLPPHLSVKDAMPVERNGFLEWYKGKIQSFIDQPGAKGAAALSRELLAETLQSPEEPNPEIAEDIMREAGETAAGLMTYLDDTETWYDQADAIFKLPNQDIPAKLDAFTAKFEKEGSKIAKEFLPAIAKAQKKEFWTQTRLAMLDAAIAYRLHGKTGFDAVIEPVMGGGFELAQTATGFEVRSKLNSDFGPEKERGKPVTLSFTGRK